MSQDSKSCSGHCSSCGEHCKDRKPSRLDSIKHKILVLSGKGGVGKSTVAASLAVSLAKAGKKTALLDVDFHGPSQPTLFNLQHTRLDGDENGVIPAETAGIKLVSLGLLVDDENAAVIWRGPAKIGVLGQLFEEVNWGTDLDYLILDFPPGTGDEVLSACQMINGDKKAIIVTTPQEVALADCRKCLDFCKKVEVPVLGVVENMSYFLCPKCSEKHALFSEGGGQALADAYDLPLLAQIPMEPDFMRECDRGHLADGLEKSVLIQAEFKKVSIAAINGRDC